MNIPKHRLTETDHMIIELSEEVKLVLIIAGQHMAIPLGLVKWGAGVAKESGVNVVFGHRGEQGVFLPLTTLKQIVEKLEEKGGEDDNPDNT